MCKHKSNKRQYYTREERRLTWKLYEVRNRLYIVMREFGKSNDTERRKDLFEQFIKGNEEQKKYIEQLNGKFKSYTEVFNEFESIIRDKGINTEYNFKFQNNGHLKLDD